MDTALQRGCERSRSGVMRNMLLINLISLVHANTVQVPHMPSAGPYLVGGASKTSGIVSLLDEVDHLFGIVSVHVPGAVAVMRIAQGLRTQPARAGTEALGHVNMAPFGCVAQPTVHSRVGMLPTVPQATRGRMTTPGPPPAPIPASVPAIAVRCKGQCCRWAWPRAWLGKEVLLCLPGPFIGDDGRSNRAVDADAGAALRSFLRRPLGALGLRAPPTKPIGHVTAGHKHSYGQSTQSSSMIGADAIRRIAVAGISLSFPLAMGMQTVRCLSGQRKQVASLSRAGLRLWLLWPFAVLRSAGAMTPPTNAVPTGGGRLLAMVRSSRMPADQGAASAPEYRWSWNLLNFLVIVVIAAPVALLVVGRLNGGGYHPRKWRCQVVGLNGGAWDALAHEMLARDGGAREAHPPTPEASDTSVADGPPASDPVPNAFWFG